MKLVACSILSLLVIALFSSANASSQLKSLDDASLLREIQPAKITDSLYPCAYDWQYPPLCRS